jgi:ABC-2 type transport system ATP-binding protein
MLDLVGRLAGFGISVILATHLLDDVQRVCEHVVMIDRGRLVLAGPIDQLMQTTGVMRVEVGGRDGAGQALADALATRGIDATLVDDHTLDVDSRQGDAAFDAVRDLIADLELRLYALSTRHRSLDDVFLQEALR